MDSSSNANSSTFNFGEETMAMGSSTSTSTVYAVPPLHRRRHHHHRRRGRVPAVLRRGLRNSQLGGARWRVAGWTSVGPRHTIVNIGFVGPTPRRLGWLLEESSRDFANSAVGNFFPLFFE